MSELYPELSEAGERRREEILRQAREAALSRKRRRNAMRAAGGLVVIAAVLLIFLYPEHSARSPDRGPQAITPATAANSQVQIVYLATDPTIAQRLTLPPEPPQWRVLNDDELLTELANAGQPAGIIQKDNQTILVPLAQR